MTETVLDEYEETSGRLDKLKPKLANAMPRGARSTIRNRAMSSTWNRRPPITMPKLSILKDEP